MRPAPPSGVGRVLVTGATGLLGHHVLAELLARGVACAALVRSPLTTQIERLGGLVGGLGVDLRATMASGQLLLLEGDINGVLPRAIGLRFDTLVHVAACTTFDAQPNGDPWRTNVEGTARMLDWASSRGVGSLHLVSSAYRCGVTAGVVQEQFESETPRFRNRYEQSKWQGEQDARAWSRQHGATLTVYRPSIVVGHSRTARTTNFGGFYVMARATKVLAQMFDGDDPATRSTGIRLVGDPAGTQNLVAVDYVAAMIATGVTNARHHGGVFHLTHPQPPRNHHIKRVLDEYFGVAGSVFIAERAMGDETLSDGERMFHDASRSVSSYLSNQPTFARENTVSLESTAGVRCLPWTDEALRALLNFAEQARWGRKPRPASQASEGRHAADAWLGPYFESWLPAHIARSAVARRSAMTVTMRFVLTDTPAVAWRCRFISGRLFAAQRVDADDEDDAFSYHLERADFWRAAAGRLDPESVFLDGRVQVRGDFEAALKMAAVLYAFNREFPCDLQAIAAWTRTRGHKPCEQPEEVVA